MNYGEIKKCDIANGEGVRVSLFVSGCTHRCQNCFNPETWNFSYGKPFDDAAWCELLQALAPDYINGLSLLGGEPFEPENQRVLLPLLLKVRSLYPRKTVWCYTGYTLEDDLLAPADGSAKETIPFRFQTGGSTQPPVQGRARCECTDEMLRQLDVLVDGEFVEAQKNISLPFRGSENQRIIDIPKTLAQGKVILYQLKNGKNMF